MKDPNGIPNNLLPYISQVAIGKLEKLGVFGGDYPTKDGTGVRDYIHVMDLAEGHLMAMAHLGNIEGFKAYNLGAGVGYSVLEMVQAFEKASGVAVHTKFYRVAMATFPRSGQMRVWLSKSWVGRFSAALMQ